MSVTRLLRNPDSWLSQFLQENVNPNAAAAFIADANSRLPEPSSAPADVDYLLSGMAFTYAFRFWVSPESWFDTVGYRGAEKLAVSGFIDYLIDELSSHTAGLTDKDWNHRLAMASCIMARFDAHQRGRKIKPQTGLLLMDDAGNVDSTKLGINLASVKDVSRLIPTIPEAWGTSGLAKPIDLESNQTFHWSRACGGGDAQMIIEGSLVEIKTSVRRHPIDLTSLYQQICYYLMDKSDEYRINRVIWYWSRHRSTLTVPISSLIKNPAQLRRKFSEAASENGIQKDSDSRFRDPILDRIWKNWESDAAAGDWRW